VSEIDLEAVHLRRRADQSYAAEFAVVRPLAQRFERYHRRRLRGMIEMTRRRGRLIRHVLSRSSRPSACPGTSGRVFRPNREAMAIFEECIDAFSSGRILRPDLKHVSSWRVRYGRVCDIGPPARQLQAARVLWTNSLALSKPRVLSNAAACEAIGA